MKTLTSELDRSVNFVLPTGQEARYVRREDEYFIVYLSSHNGCNKACRFCHLTQTGQTDYVETTMEGFLDQAKLVLDHYRQQVSAGREAPAKRVNFNWMARGEPLDNSVVVGEWEALVANLKDLCIGLDFEAVNFNISTIVPKTYTAGFKFCGETQPHIYYSLYSLEERFRSRWLPKAACPEEVMDALVAWQGRTEGQVTLHWTFIEGENDSDECVAKIMRLVQQKGLDAKFNLVRYNPYSDSQGRESSEQIIEMRFQKLSSVMTAPGSRVVPRVGFDVKASCGMFVSREETHGN